jgi:hypothetical protein
MTTFSGSGAGAGAIAAEHFSGHPYLSTHIWAHPTIKLMENTITNISTLFAVIACIFIPPA